MAMVRKSLAFVARSVPSVTIPGSTLLIWSIVSA
jgi:hypothetical protein